MDSGAVTISRGTNTASAGSMPCMTWATIHTGYYGEKTVGYARYFTAKEHGHRADLIVQIQRNGSIMTSDKVDLVAFADDGTTGSYRIIQIQHVVDGEGQPMTDLTLERIDGLDPA